VIPPGANGCKPGHDLMDDTRTRNTASRYMPQLDGLRAFAVGAVLIHHFFQPPRFAGVDFALLGVWLFFVLSGFLITGILLRSRDSIHDRSYPVSFALRQFYVRRVLRIFPLYYLVLFGAAAFDVGDVRDTIFWHLTYMSNYLFSTRQQWGQLTAHFWSLSVEEQFYILWPTLILFASARFLPKMIITAITIGPIFRAVAHLLDFNWIARLTVSLASLDALGLGALLAYCLHHLRDKPGLLKALDQWIRWLGAPGFILLCLLHRLEAYNLIHHVTEHSWFIEPALWALLFVWLIKRAASGFIGLAGKILELKPLVYTGKISYGIYVYHPFVYFFLPLLFDRIGVDFFLLPPLLQFSLAAGSTVALAALSWRLVESPINSLKERFVGERVGPRCTLQSYRSQTAL
jgi:peptidoglycan/LPS O-acetylase OafA/YrhL